MIPIKLLVIDALVFLVFLSSLGIIQRWRQKFPFNDNLKIDESFDNDPDCIPKLKELLDLERVARKKGSGIDFPSLIGIWKFVSVWKQSTDKEDLTSSSLLRLFSASLELKEDEANKDCLQFKLINSIQFGFLSIRFLGRGALKGSQPLLPFFFESIELKFGSNVLFSRSLEQPDDKNRPFFALIAMDKDLKWLSARGRGGGLALWIKD